VFLLPPDWIIRACSGRRRTSGFVINPATAVLAAGKGSQACFDPAAAGADAKARPGGPSKQDPDER
jgi:hypothetical protein